MAGQLIESMSVKWEPEMYHDDYHEALKKLIDEKVEHGEKNLPAPKHGGKPANVIDLVSVLQQSIRESQGKARFKTAPRTTGKRRQAA